MYAGEQKKDGGCRGAAEKVRVELDEMDGQSDQNLDEEVRGQQVVGKRNIR